MFLIAKKSCSKKQFIIFWSKQYDYPNELLYVDNIGKELTEKSTMELFEWKNGRPLSDLKKQSVYDNYINEVDLLSEEAGTNDIKSYLNRPGGAIWRIFWLHCNYPKKFPIFDQHVYRAMAYLNNKNDIEIMSYNPKKVESYVLEYLDFHSSFKYEDNKKLDEALWAFGKFLSYGYKL